MPTVDLEIPGFDPVDSKTVGIRNLPEILELGSGKFSSFVSLFQRRNLGAKLV